MKQFLYKLKLRKDLLDDKNWTDKENKIVENHFLHLKEGTEQKRVILAGRTLNPDESSFGIVIFLATTKTEALEYMNQDPAVKHGIMTAKLFPYRVALIQNDFKV